MLAFQFRFISTRADDHSQLMALVHRHFVILKSHKTPGAVLPLTAYTGRLRPKGVPFFRLQVYKRLGISQVEVYKRVGKSVVSQRDLNE